MKTLTSQSLLNCRPNKDRTSSSPPFRRMAGWTVLKNGHPSWLERLWLCCWGSIMSSPWSEMKSDAQTPRSMSLSSWRMSHSRKGSGISPLHWWMRYTSIFRRCWMAVPSDPPSCHGAMPWCWWGRRMGRSSFVLTSVASTPGPRRMPTPCHACKRPWEAWLAPGTFLAWTWRVGSGKLKWLRRPDSTLPLQ